MLETMVVLCSCGDSEAARRIANALVDQRLAACVSILPAIESVYRWREKIESANEALLLIKTASHRFPALQEKILELHGYDTPEIIALPVVAGLEKYLGWLGEQVSSPDR
jgi:periplasmic divalent cation tolerance protein